MAVVVFLSEPHLEVEPGEEAVCEIRLRNASRVVDQFSLQLLGDAESWSTVEPRIINLLPDTEATARVVFHPPRSPEVLAGTVDYGVRIASREDPLGSVVEEGDLQVAPFTEVVTELVPQKGRGRRRAKYKLAVDNNGNQDTVVAITAVDPDDALDILVDPPNPVTKPGTTTLVKTKVVPHKRFLKGDPQTHGFQLATMADGHDPVTTDGVMIQEQLMPKWLLPALAVALAAVAVLVGLWFAVLRPTVQSMATDAAAQEATKAVNAAQQSAIASPKAGAGGAGQQADGAGGAGGPGHAGDAQAVGGRAGKQPGSKPGGRAGAVADPPVVFRIATTTKPVTDGSFQDFTYLQPNHKALDISDIVMQNPRGDSGYLQIKIGSKVVLDEGLANFRDLDEPFIVPLHVNPEQPVIVSINCTAPGTALQQCTPSASFSARLAH